MQQGEREIFGYFDGTRERWADPLRVNRELHRLLDGAPNAFLEDAKASRPGADGLPVPAWDVAAPAVDRLLAAVRVALPMAPFDEDTGAGATERDCWAALRDFLDYLKKKPANTAGLPSSSTSGPVASAAP